MQMTEFYAMPPSPSFSFLLESEEDFLFGAKTTSFLPPATVTNAAKNTSTTTTTSTSTTTASYDLPEWMEGREILGLPHLFEGDSVFKQDGGDYCSTIKPEDMLVPLSQMQPPRTPGTPPLTNTPPATPPYVPVSPPLVPASPASPDPADPPLPKIIICRKVTSSALKSKPIEVHFQVKPVKQEVRITPATPATLPLLHTAHHTPHTPPHKNTKDQVAFMPLTASHTEPIVCGTTLEVPQTPSGPQAHQECDAEELINEMVQMIGSSSSSSGGFQDLEASVVGANMDDFLSQLEATDSLISVDSESIPHSSIPSLPTITTSLHSPPSPLPSESISVLIPSEPSLSISPPSPHPSESLSHSSESISISPPSPHPLESISISPPSPHPSESISISPPSPHPLESLSPPSPHPSESISISAPSPHTSESISISAPSPHTSESLTLLLPCESPFSVSIPSPHPSELSSPACLPSPVPSVGSLSPAQSSSDSLFCGDAEASTDMDCQEDEWSPLEETHSYSRSQRKARSSRRTAGARGTPYPENRKERKKEQNKQAALRYRQKKKQEEDDVQEKIDAEEERQRKLQSKYSGLKQELKYLKKMMREMFLARGLLTEEALKKAALEKEEMCTSK